MAVLLGALASVLIGCSDFLGRYGTRRSNAVTATSGAMVGGAASAIVAVFLISGVFTARDVALGAVSGVLVGVALALLYEAMATSSAAVAGPLVALGAALVPLAWDLLGGNVPTTTVRAGVLVALASLVLVMYSPELRGTLQRGIGLSVVASLLFGSSLVLIGSAGDDGGAWAPAAQRVVAMTAMLTIATLRSVPRLPPGPLLRPMLLSGVCGTGAIVAFTLGTQVGSLTAVAVAASMFPAVAATLSATFDDDTLRWWQLIGILGVIAGIALMAAG